MQCFLCEKPSSPHHGKPMGRRCVKCNDSYCISCTIDDCRNIPCSEHHSCWNEHIEQFTNEKLKALHQPANPTAEMFIRAITCSDLDDAQIKALHGHDKLARWFSVKKGKEEDDKPELWLYDRFRRLCDPHQTGNRITGNHYPSIVSFIGNTYAGKSTVVRAMLLLGLAEQRAGNSSDALGRENALYNLLQSVLDRPEKHELPVSQGGDDPATFGVHLYRNNITTQPEPSPDPQYPLLLADCEGFTADFALTNAEKAVPDTEDPDEQVETRTIKADDYGRGKAGIDLFYARFLYAVSDVVVFVTQNPKTKGHDFPRILEWAAGAMLKTFNQPSGKTLIVVRNKYTPDKKDSTPEMLKQEFLESQSPTLWKRTGVIATFVERFNASTSLGLMIRSNNDLYRQLFRSIHLCYIPDNNHVDNHGKPEKLLEHFGNLKRVLDRAVVEERDIRAESLTRYNVAGLSLFLSNTFRHFSESSTPLDFYKATCRDNHTPTNLREHIANFLRLAYDRENRVNNNQLAGMDSMIENVIALSLLILARRRDSATFTPEIKFDHDLRKYWDGGLALYQLLHEQCSYTFLNSQGALTPYSCQVRGHGGKRGKHQQHVPPPSGPGHRHNLQPVPGDFVPGHDWNRDVWRQRIRARFCELYRKVYRSPLPPHQDSYEPQPAGQFQQQQLQQQQLQLRDREFNHHGNQQVDTSILKLRRELTPLNKPLFAQLLSTKTCLSCLLSSPDHASSCGHAFCPRCIQELSTPSRWKAAAFELDSCILCDGQDGHQTIQLRPRCSGVRILTLDGGGVRGIVELALVQALEQEIGLTNVRLAEMFDLIVGTSTGGIVALALTFPGKLPSDPAAVTSSPLARRGSGIDTRMQDMIAFFSKISTATFENSRLGWRALTRGAMVFRRVESVYSDRPLRSGLEQYFGDKTSLFAPTFNSERVLASGALGSGVRVAVTSTRDDGDTEVVIGNYNRPLTTYATDSVGGGSSRSGFEREDDLEKDFKIWEAAMATAAAPFYLPVFKREWGVGGQEYIDGAVYANCPARVAMDEKTKIWSRESGEGNGVVLDALVSLGTGKQGPKSDKMPFASNFRGFTALQKMIKRQLDTERLWEGVVEGAERSQRGRLMRLNPELKPKYVQLYQCEEVPRLLKETGEWAGVGGQGRDKIKNVARVLMAGMFFFEVPDSYSPRSTLSHQQASGGPDGRLLRGAVRCRLRHQAPAVGELLRKVTRFYHTELTTEEAAEEEKSLASADRQWRTLTDITSGSVNPRDMVRVRERNPDGTGIEQFRLDFELRVRDKAALQAIVVEFQADDESDARSINEQENERGRGKRFAISGFPVTLADLNARGQRIWLQ
ncbi:hypothetical protein QC762_310000 [Podospora pseudocomata]|uniref:PNPLA domain-containing protein n=1 Tax=Podospora pseudocomata TaxID=2093779 RepID=A0ABR0GKY2_9PEZI|nr:hypothetical protein QC762_310000 [Podospora pseudocomata]